MRRSHPILIIGPERPLRAAFVEQFSADPDFSAAPCVSAADVSPEIEGAVIMPDAPVSEGDVRSAGLRGPVLTLGVGTLTLPVRFSALASQMRAALRAHEQSDEAALPFSGYALHPGAKVLETPDGDSIKLTDKEADIIRFLHRAGGETVSRQRLLEDVWGYQSEVTTHTLETHIYRLRQKIEPIAGEITLIQTDQGGYRLAI